MQLLGDTDRAALLRSWQPPPVQLTFTSSDPLLRSFNCENPRPLLPGVVRAVAIVSTHALRRATTERTFCVTDTSYLMSVVPARLDSFCAEYNAVLVIPFIVLQELDHINKTNTADRQFVAREARNWLLTKVGRGDPDVQLLGGGDVDATVMATATCNDDRIVGCAVYLKKQRPGRRVVLCTMDKMMALKALAERVEVIGADA